MTGWLRCSWIIVLTVAACASSKPRPIRYGSLELGERSFVYSHGVETLKLQNGLTVAMVPDARADLVAVDVRYVIGDVDDPDDRRGLAHLVEHMMFERRAAPGMPTTTDRLSAIALDHNAKTRWDATHYHTLAVASALDELLAIEAERIAGGCAGLDQAAFDRERAIVSQELAQRGDAEVLDRLLGELYGGSHAYTRRATGADIAAMTLEDVCRFIDAHYAPDRAILVIAGRFDAGAVRRALATRLAPITRRAHGAPAVTKRRPLTGGVLELHAELDEPSVLVMFPAAPWGSAEAFDDELVDGLLVRALGNLDREQAWITGVDSGQLGGSRDGARYFALSVADPARLHDAADAIFRAASELPGADSGLALGVLAGQRRTELLDGFESIADRGELVADYLQRTTDRRFHLRELAALAALDTDRLNARARYLKPAASRVVRLVPDKARGRARPQLRTAVAALDAAVWQAPVDPAEADQPIALEVDRRATVVSDERLSNGLRLVMANDFTQPVVEARLVFPIGERGAGPDDPVLANAAAALLEQGGARSYSLKDFAIVDWVMRLGARLSANVDDHTTFTVRGTSTFADWHVWRLHWLLENGSYTEDDIARAGEAAARSTRERDHRRSWRRALRTALFGAAHPYARVLDPRVLAARLLVDDLERFRDAHYRANGATLMIVGKFDAVAMRRTVTELFGTWSAAPPPPPAPVPAMQPAAGPTWLAHVDPDASQVRITVAFAARSPRGSSAGAREIVGEMIDGRVAQVRMRLGASYGVSAAYQRSAAGDAIFIDGYVDTARAGEAIRQMQVDLDGLRGGDTSVAADFVRARRAVLARALGDPLKVSSVADELESAITDGLAIDHAATLPAAIAATTLAEARAVLATDLAPARMVAVVSGRPAEVRSALQGGGVARFATVSADTK